MDLECERVTKSQGKENDGPTPRESEKDKVRQKEINRQIRVI